MSYITLNGLVTKKMSIEEAMQIIEGGGCKTAFLVEENMLLGTVTDGDVRRHLLSGGTISDNICQIVNYKPKFFFEGEKVNYQEYMIKNVLQALPIVDEGMHLIRVEKLQCENTIIQQIEENVPVVMMAGGLGTRLKPYTDIIPKPLIPIGNKTIAEHIFNKFILFGCDELYMILNYKKSLIEAYFNEIKRYSKLSYIEEPFFMGTAGGIRLVHKYCTKNFFLVNCDILVNYDYCSLWKYHVENKNIITMVLAKKRIVVPYGTALIDENKMVKGLKEKPELTYNINTGLYMCNSKIYEYLKENEKIDMPNLIVRCLEAGEKVGQVTIDEDDWYDMGQPEELEMMKKKLGIIYEE